MVAASNGLLHGPLSAGTVHVCLDMQNLFGPAGPWATPWMERVLPVTVQLARHYEGRTLFTRFIPPVSADDEIGVWRRFYRRWEQITQPHLWPGALDLVDELLAVSEHAPIIDKTRFSAFSAPAFHEALMARRADTLILSGAETDMCVLATALGAIDAGFRVIIVEDAVCSSSDEGHDALMALYRHRFAEQVETIESDKLMGMSPPR